mmetsp:Transcript_49372/g.56873  ORF Transcript_49372/g.56873 Transcript_49372/m.56873 type:complete len:168 (-) Transcript_49372:227-730(-)
MSKKLPVGDMNTRRLKPLTASTTTSQTIKEIPTTLKQSQNFENDQFYEENLKDYDSLLNYCMKLIDENKSLLTENATLRTENDETLTLNLELLQENEGLRKDKDKLVDDSLVVIDYNEQLLDDKTKHDEQFSTLIEKFKMAVSLLTPEARTTICSKHPGVLEAEGKK